MSAAATPGPIAPHGGTLVERFDDSLDEGGGRPRVTLSARQQADLDLIAIGALSPLDGFMGRDAYESVVDDMRLPGGLAWSVPVTLGVSPEELEHVGSSDEVELVDESGRFLGVLEVTDRYATDPAREARLVYGTEDDAHPGVASLYAHGTTASPARCAWPPGCRSTPPPSPSCSTRAPRAPSSTSAAGRPSSASRRATRSTARTSTSPRSRWRSVDGLFIHPLVGETKSDDIPADVRMRCYEVLLENYYPPERVRAGRATRPRCATPARARRSSTRILRQNYGCTHFIVGRDHAGVGNYYGTYDAQRIFDDITRDELGIQPLIFEHSFWCKPDRRHGDHQDLARRPGGPRLPLGHQGARDARPRGVPAGRVHPPRGGGDPHRGLLGDSRLTESGPASRGALRSHAPREGGGRPRGRGWWALANWPTSGRPLGRLPPQPRGSSATSPR